jgi:transcriptional regulator with XRE-family HTH domain
MSRLFGEKLRYLRRWAGMTQVDLAHRLALASHAHITNLETSQDVASLELVLRVARLFGVATDYLLRSTIPVEEIGDATIELTADADVLPRLFGKKLRTLRLDHNLTQVALARQLGLAGQAHLSNLEAGRKLPSLDLVVQIADLFGVTTDYLLCDAIALRQHEDTTEAREEDS